MSWAARIARIAGIDIKVHVTFLIILVLGGLQWSADYGAVGFAFGAALMVALFTCVVLHPGWVRTDMGGENATYSPQESVTGLVTVIENLKPADNGRFFDFKGNPIPW
jgi:hypothetical protein